MSLLPAQELVTTYRHVSFRIRFQPVGEFFNKIIAGQPVAMCLGTWEFPSSWVFKLLAYAFLTARHKRENALPLSLAASGTKTVSSSKA